MLLNLVVKNLINLQRLMAAHKFRVNKASTARGVTRAGGGGEACASLLSFVLVARANNKFVTSRFDSCVSQRAATLVATKPQQGSSNEGGRSKRGYAGGCGGRKKAHSHTVSQQLALTAADTVRTVVQLQGKRKDVKETINRGSLRHAKCSLTLQFLISADHFYTNYI